MPLTAPQTAIMIAAIALGAVITRFFPFILFPDNKEAPVFVKYLGKVLPPAMMGLLVVYCFKAVSFTSAPFGVPEIIGIAVIVILHTWKKNVLLSIAGGTVIYMILVQAVFN